MSISDHSPLVVWTLYALAMLFCAFMIWSLFYYMSETGVLP